MVARALPVILVAAILLVPSAGLRAAETVQHPFLGVTHIIRTETSPRNVTMHVVLIDLTVPGIRFRLTPPGGTLETIRQTTLGFLNQEQAQVAINSHFFLPFPSPSPFAMLIGLAASEGRVYSAFEAPIQSYALATNAPALNIDPSNRASIVHADTSFPDGTHVVEDVTLWNALAGSAQIVTNGVKTIPTYRDAQNPDGLLTPGSPANYSNSNSWYSLFNARVAVGLSQDNQTLILFTVDRAGGSLGLSVGEVADLLINDYGVYNALNLDGGGSTTLAMEDPVTHIGAIVNVSSDNPAGRSVASNLAVFAALDAISPFTTALASPGANAKGWNNTDVTVTLNAADNHGGFVRDIYFALAGAQAGDPQVVPGQTASSRITSEGTTTLTYSATDYAGNQETARSHSVGIDKTQPVITGMPDEGCTLWPANGEMVRVAKVKAADALSGVAAGSLVVTVTSNQPSNPRNPDFSVITDGSGVFKVVLRAKRSLPREERVYKVEATVRDLADNVTTATAVCAVPLTGKNRR